MIYFCFNVEGQESAGLPDREHQLKDREQDEEKYSEADLWYQGQSSLITLYLGSKIDTFSKVVIPMLELDHIGE